MSLNHEDPGGWYALLLAGIVTAIGAIWKSWFSFRRDKREDNRGTVVNGSYQDLVKSLREQLHEEREIRHRLEEENLALRKLIAGHGIRE